MAKKLVTGERGWTAHSHHVKAMLGLAAKAKLPAAGMPEQVIQGITIYVKPLDANRNRTHKVHRVMAICPDCGLHLSAGRLHQHKC